MEPEQLIGFLHQNRPVISWKIGNECYRDVMNLKSGTGTYLAVMPARVDGDMTLLGHPVQLVKGEGVKLCHTFPSGEVHEVDMKLLGG